MRRHNYSADAILPALTSDECDSNDGIGNDDGLLVTIKQRRAEV